MKHSCTIDGLSCFLKYTPRLRHLICASLNYTYDAIENDVPLILPNLTYFWIYYCNIPFDEFQQFIEKNFSQLHVFRIDTFSNENYINPDRWKPLILQNMSQLRRFRFTYSINWDANFVDHHFQSFVHHFSSPFWIKQDFNVQLYVTSESIDYTLRSNSRIDREGEFKEFLQSVITSNRSICHDTTQDNSAHQSPAPIHLSIGYQNDPWSISFMNSVSFILLAIPTTNLFIGLHKMPLSMFIRIIRSLPNLSTLHVPELSFDQLSSLSIEEKKDIRYFSINNKVTDVNHSADLNLTEFLIILCPRMEYLKMSFISDISHETFIRLVLMKTITHTPNLHSMNIWLYKANDQMVRKLQNMINSEKLLTDYIIKRWKNNIILKWKLE
ncbi:hypothetical protein I4U23_031468 [Adineta vaga]|nr:hypothetical protein I4U23_031468 [Adineta vaga]